MPRASDWRMAADGGADAAGGFDVSQFDSILSLQALRVRKADVHELCVVLRRLGALFDMPRLCSVVADEASPEERLVLLNEAVSDAGEALPPSQPLLGYRTQSRSTHRASRAEWPQRRGQACRARAKADARAVCATADIQLLARGARAEGAHGRCAAGICCSA